MKKIYLLILVFSSIFIYSQNLQKGSSNNQSQEEQYRENEFILLLNEDATDAINLEKVREDKSVIGVPNLDTLSKSIGVISVDFCFNQSLKLNNKAKALGLDRYFLVKLPKSTDLDSVMRQFQDLPEVEMVEYNYVVKTHFTPNDPFYGEQWGLKNTSNAKQYGTSALVGIPGSDINVEPAWDLHNGVSNPVTIAILDTGVDYNHPEFSGRMLSGYDFMNNDNDPMDEDFDGHGTSCAGIAAAAGNNGIGVAGVNWGADILPVKVLHNGTGSNTAVANGVVYAVDNGADVISMSLGSSFPSSLIENSVNYAYNSNVLVFASRGNGDNSQDNYPSSYPNVISVGGLSPCDTRKTPFSCDGESWWGASYGGGPDKMDFVAPAARITTTDITGIGGYSSNEYTDSFNGTSAACPFAAGVGALIKSYNPSLGVDDIRNIMRNTAVDIDAVGYDAETGYGKINAEAALLAAIPNDFWFTVQDINELDTCNSTNNVNINFDFFRLPTAGNEDVSLSLTGLPFGLIGSFSPALVTSEDSFSLDLTGITALTPGEYNFIIQGLSSSFSYDLPVTIDVYDSITQNVNLTFPANNQNSLGIPFAFEWSDLINANSYQIQIATESGFTNIIEDNTTNDPEYTALNISEGNEYYWRVKPLNSCGDGTFSTVFSFVTACSNTANLALNFASASELNLIIENSSASSWEIEYVASGTAPTGTGSIFSSSAPNFDNLNSDTCYDFYVRSNCNVGFSSWNGPYQFCTSPDYCNGDSFYDSGGPNGNYSNGENNITTIYPSPGFNTITVDFISFQTESCCDSLFIYDGDDINAPIIGQYQGSNSPGTITSTNTSGALTFQFFSDGSITSSGWEASVTCEFISCKKPTNLLATNVTQTEAELNWVAGDAETQWEIEYGPTGFTQGSGTLLQTATNPYNLTGLNPITSYDVYIRANCGTNPGDDDSIWSGPITFSTLDLYPPDALTAELTDQTSGTVDLNWSEPNSIIGNWVLYYNFNCSGSYNNSTITFYDDFTFQGPSSSGTWVLNGDQITWTYSNNFQYFGTVQGNYMSGTNSGGGCWYADKILSGADSTVEFTVSETLSNGEQAINPGETYTYTFSQNNSNTVQNFNVYRDNVIIGSTSATNYTDVLPTFGIYDYHVTAVYNSGESVPSNTETVNWLSCPEPTNLSVANVSLSSAEISWDSAGSESEWEIEYGTTGFTQGNGTVVQTPTNPYTLTGLSPNTSYDVYLRANCGTNPGDDDSVWVGPVNFSTEDLIPPDNLTAQIDQQSGQVILNWDEGTPGIQEDFNDGVADNWIPITGTWNVSNGTYQVTTNSENISSSYYDEDFDAFEIETQIRKTSGSGYNIGLYFNGDETDINFEGEWNNGYAFMISADGNWNLVRYLSGNFSSINGGWSSSPDIIQGLGSWNTLKIVYANGYIEAYINDVLQGTFYDTTFTSGKIGIKMYDSSQGSAELDYININSLSTADYNFESVNQPEIRNLFDSSECVNTNTCTDADILQTVSSPIPPILNYTYSGSSASQDFLNYNIYRDGVLLGISTVTSYTDMLTAFGTYDYHVTAVYNQGESVSSNIATVVYQGVSDISVNPTAMFETLPEGGTSTQVLTITNTGDGPLNFDISSTVINGFGNGEPVVTAIPDNTPYVISNSENYETYTPGLEMLTSTYSFSTVQNVLILEDTNLNSAYEQALINLNLPYTLVTGYGSFLNALTGPTDWDLVILNSYLEPGSTSTYTALDNYLNNDGRLIFAHWNLDDYTSHPLLTSMGVNFVQNFSNPLSIFPLNSSSTLFNNPNIISGINPTNNQYLVDGQIVNVLTNSDQVAYFNGYSSSGAIVVNESNTSIFNGFQSANFQGDENSNGKQDVIELIENEISYLLGANWLSADPTTGTVASGSSININVTFDATNLIVGTYDATLDITSNDPDEALVSVPAQLIVLAPSCPEPTNLAISNVTGDSAELSWDDGDTETQWEIEYGITGFTQGNGTIVQTTNNPYVLSGLNSITTYDVYLRANCGSSPGDDDSIWVGPINFTTPADYCNGDLFYDSGGPTGNYSNGENITTTIYPSSGFNTISVDFISFQTESCCDILRIYDGDNINAPLIGQYQGNNSPGSITSTSPGGALTFLFTSDGSVTTSGWEATVTCEFISCPEPSNFQTSGVTETSVDLSWDTGDTETQWEIEHGTTGFIQGNGTFVQASTNPYTLTGLSPNTSYDVYLRANCGTNPGDDDSNWIGPFSFTTSCGIYTAPMYEHFSDSFTPNCWEESGSENWKFSLGADYDAIAAGDHTTGQNTNYAWIDGSVPNGFGHISYLRTMQIDVSQLVNPSLQFSVFSENTNDFSFNTLNVTVTNSINESLNVLALQGSTNNWETYTIDLSNITLNSTIISVEFSIEENSPGSPYYNDILIDDVIIDESEVLNVDEFDVDSLSYFPNPVSDILHVKYSKMIDKIEVFNLLGQNLKNIDNNSNSLDVNISLFNSGTYFLKIYSGSSYQVIKVIKR